MNEPFLAGLLRRGTTAVIDSFLIAVVLGSQSNLYVPISIHGENGVHDGIGEQRTTERFT